MGRTQRCAAVRCHLWRPSRQHGPRARTETHRHQIPPTHQPQPPPPTNTRRWPVLVGRCGRSRSLERLLASPEIKARCTAARPRGRTRAPPRRCLPSWSTSTACHDCHEHHRRRHHRAIPHATSNCVNGKSVLIGLRRRPQHAQRHAHEGPRPTARASTVPHARPRSRAWRETLGFEAGYQPVRAAASLDPATPAPPAPQPVCMGKADALDGAIAAKKLAHRAARFVCHAYDHFKCY